MNFKLASHPVRCGEALSRSYGCFFAEFLGDHSLVRLGLIDLITCVGLRYGFYIHKFREFSWKRALYHRPPALLEQNILTDFFILNEYYLPPKGLGNFLLLFHAPFKALYGFSYRAQSRHKLQIQ